MSYSWRFFAITVLSVLYVTLNLLCNPMFWRHIDITVTFTNYTYMTNCSIFVFPLLYIISDIIVAITNRKFAIMIVMVGIICEVASAYFVMAIVSYNGYPSPSMDTLTKDNAVMVLGIHIWDLVYFHVYGTFLASSLEIILFYFLLRVVSSFALAIVLSVTAVLFIHNFITDYFVLYGDADKFQIFFRNSLTEVVIVLCYTLICTLFIYLFKIKHIFRQI